MGAVGDVPPVPVITAVKLTGWPTFGIVGVKLKSTAVMEAHDALTICVSGADVLGLKLLLPLYVAVIVCVPVNRDAVLILAVPFESTTVLPAVPSV